MAERRGKIINTRIKSTIEAASGSWYPSWGFSDGPCVQKSRTNAFDAKGRPSRYGIWRAGNWWETRRKPVGGFNGAQGQN